MEEKMAFKLPELPYGYDALEPFIDEQTLRIHHGKHHAGYVNKLNAAIEKDPQWQNKTLEEIIKNAEGGIFNNAAQVWNHTFYFESMKPGGSKPEGDLLTAINNAFGSFEKFKEEFSQKAATLFGSGWTWLVKDGDSLKIIQTQNADTPLRHGLKALLTIDVWEHAYYLKYQNRRPDYIEAWWNVVDWDRVLERYNS